MSRTFSRKSLGKRKRAEKVVRKVQKNIPAYAHYLKELGIRPDTPFEELPTLDKKSYILSYSYQELLGNNQTEIAAFVRSSGSSGSSFYWPLVKSPKFILPLRSSHVVMRKALEKIFSINQKKTLAIVGGSLEWSWGEISAWTLKNIAVRVPYPFWVVCPGKKIDGIIEIIHQFNPTSDQILLFIVPSAIPYLHQRAEALSMPLPLRKIRYLVSGEPFPETLRTSLQKSSGVQHNTPFMLSLYGSNDTGGLGTEFLPSVALRKLLDQNPVIAEDLGIKPPVPHFFYFTAPDAFLETVDGNLCVTRWQGIPIVRYLLYDRVAFYNWPELRRNILSSKQLQAEDLSWIEILKSASKLLPHGLIALTGRTDRCIILGADNIEEYMLDEAVRSEELNQVLTGFYRAKVHYEAGRQYLLLDLEVLKGLDLDKDNVDQIYDSLVKALGHLQPSFREEYESIYSASDADPSKRILRLNFLPWPSLSESVEDHIKQRGINPLPSS